MRHPHKLNIQIRNAANYKNFKALKMKYLWRHRLKSRMPKYSCSTRSLLLRMQSCNLTKVLDLYQRSTSRFSSLLRSGNVVWLTNLSAFQICIHSWHVFCNSTPVGISHMGIYSGGKGSRYWYSVYWQIRFYFKLSLIYL